MAFMGIWVEELGKNTGEYAKSKLTKLKYRVTHQVVPKLRIQGLCNSHNMNREFWNNLMCHPVHQLMVHLVKHFKNLLKLQLDDREA